MTVRPDFMRIADCLWTPDEHAEYERIMENCRKAIERNRSRQGEDIWKWADRLARDLAQGRD